MLVRAGAELAGRPDRGDEPPRWGRREWVLATGAVTAFVLLIEVAALGYGLRGPVELLADDIVGRPMAGEVKIAGVLLTVVCLPARLRIPFVGAVAALELAFNAQRLAVGSHLHFGNGVMIALIGLAGYALWRLRGPEQTATLKAVGISALLIVSSRVAGVFLELTMQALPTVLDHYVEVADRALGSPSWVMGEFVHTHGWYLWLITKVYTYLPVGAAIVALVQLRGSAIRGFPRHHVVRSFVVIGAIGPLVYFLFPVVGPSYAFGDAVAGAGWMNVWPSVIPTALHPIAEFFSQVAPRNCMPSLHTAWSAAIMLHALRGPRLLKVFGVFWFVCTVCATLGIGAHYGIDLIAGLVFVLTIETALVRPEDGWHARRVTTILAGAATFATVLLCTRFLSVEMATSGYVPAFALLGAVVAMGVGYARVAWPPKVALSETLAQAPIAPPAASGEPRGT